MIELQNKLMEFGEILVLKNDYVLTLLMKIKNHQAKNIFKISNLVTEYAPDKPKVEVMKNDDEFILIVLKP